MKNIQYLIVFLLMVVIGLQGYYIYVNKTNNPSVSQKILPVKQLNQPLVKDDDLDKIFAGNPFEQMQKMEQNMQKIFNSMNSQFAAMPEFKKFFNKDMSISPALNMKSYKDRYELSASIPGSEKNNIKINTKNGVLTIEARTKNLKDQKNPNFIKKEMYEGTFIRSLSLPSDADTGNLKTEYKDGILKIVIPKKK
ncbi:MAG: Hsp20/alpha crystallin family protein [Sulfurospirillum sp.]